MAGFYRYCEQEEILPRSPAAHIRRPKQDYESHTLGLDRNVLGGFLVAAGLSSNRDHALASLLSLNGLRISEALGADIEQLSTERGHRTLRILRKGGKQVTIPLAPRTARAIDLCVGERLQRPIFVGPRHRLRVALHSALDEPDDRADVPDDEKVILHRFVAHVGATRVRTELDWVPWLMPERLDRVLIGCRRFIDDLPSSSRAWFEEADVELRSVGI